MSSKNVSSPPRPRLVVQVGVIGHRPNRLAAGMTEHLMGQCQQILSLVQDIVSSAHDPLLYSPATPLIRIISPLAEGSDRIAARAGLAFGAELQCPLPFPAAEYEHDFKTEPAREEFHSLLSKASAVLELEGVRGDEDAAYERVGRAVIYQSDIVIAIWDGGPAAGRGGTTQMLDEAMALKVPIVWLHANREMEPCLLATDDRGKRIEKPVTELSLQFASRFLLSTSPQVQLSTLRAHITPKDCHGWIAADSLRYFATWLPRGNGHGVHGGWRILKTQRVRIGKLRLTKLQIFRKVRSTI